jgi:protein-S-isoprenylcysteine O-methyltransferase Ste14
VSLKPYIYVFFQLSALVFIALNVPLFKMTILSYIAIIGSILLGIWALWTIHPQRVNILPVPHPNGVLVTHGPYAVIRHPMYTAQLFAALVAAIESALWLNAGVWLLYMVLLVMKAAYEEQGLVKQFSDYREYQQKTWRLVPFLY